MVTRITILDATSLAMDELLEALASAKITKTEYELNGLPPPDLLVERITSMQEEVKSRRRDYLQRALKQAQARQSTLKTREEKATEVAAEIAKLQKELAQ